MTGGGTEVIGEILRHGNGSATILEAFVPYSSDALKRFIGKEPDKYASSETAREIAMIAYQRALRLSEKNDDIKTENIIGIGITCKLAKESGEREGREHEIHFASQSHLRSSSYSLKIKEGMTREEEEKLASILTIYKIAELCGIDHNEPQMERINKKITELGDIFDNHSEVDENTGNLLLDTLLGTDYEGKKSVLIFEKNREIPAYTKLILSGSFNPCHKNHILMAKIASTKYQLPITFEISLANVDKPPIDFISLDYRLRSLKNCISSDLLDSTYLTNAPLFADKAILFPNSRFIIGSDTLNRLFNSGYYRENENKITLLNHFKKWNATFVVFHRKNIDPIIDEDIMQICDIIPFEEYMDDGTSSTKIRMQNKS